MNRDSDKLQEYRDTSDLTYHALAQKGDGESRIDRKSSMGFVDMKADDTVQSPTYKEWQEGYRFRAKRRLPQFR